MIVTERERERERGRDTGGGRSSMPGARRGIRSWVSRIAPWAKGRRQTAAPPRDPPFPFFIGNTDRTFPTICYEVHFNYSKSLIHLSFNTLMIERMFMSNNYNPSTEATVNMRTFIG